MSDPELDVRVLRKPEKHPRIFATYDALPAGGSFVLVNDHDPRHLRDEFETEHPGSYGWEYLSRERRNYRIRITKLTAAPLPRVVADTGRLAPGPGGAVWALSARDRDLDVDITDLPANEAGDLRTGPDVDAVVHVLGGSGRLVTEAGAVDLAPGAVLWLPRRSQRGFAAGPDGLRYLTVQQRRPAIALDVA